MALQEYFYFSLLPLILIVSFILGRFGFEQLSLVAYLKAYGFSLFLINAPVFARGLGLWGRRVPAEPREKTFQDFSVHLGSLVFITGASFLGFRWALGMGFLVSGLGYLFFFDLLRQITSRDQKHAHVIEKIIFLCSSLYLVALLYSTPYHDPLFWVRLATGKVAEDSLCHLAVSGMLKTYQTSSVGLDGLVLWRYHVGSHWWFGQLSNLLGMSVEQIYHFIYPAALVPLYLLSVFGLASSFSKAGLAEHRYAFGAKWAVFILSAVGIFPLEYLNQTTSHHYKFISESYILSLLLAFLGAGVLRQALAGLRKESGRRETLLVMGVFVFVILIALTKVSVGLLALFVLGYLAIRYRLIAGGRGVGIVAGF